MRYLILSITLIIISCSSIEKGLTRIPLESTGITNPYFSNPQRDYVYKASFKVYNNRFGGIFIVKKLDKNQYAIVLTTEFGHKILEFEMTNSKIEKKYILPELDKEIVVEALKSDFFILINEHQPVDEQFKQQNEKIYKSRDLYYYVEENKLTKIVSTKKRKPRVTFSFEGVTQDLAKSIQWQHHQFNFKAQLFYMGN